ncbi:MAG: hypothetical protein ACLUFV_07370 [Acutalibacteraceae bacterium]
MMLDALAAANAILNCGLRNRAHDPTKPDVLTGCLLKIAVGGSEALVTSGGRGRSTPSTSRRRSAALSVLGEMR